jgi:hypothetical protein
MHNQTGLLQVTSQSGTNHFSGTLNDTKGGYTIPISGKLTSLGNGWDSMTFSGTSAGISIGWESVSFSGVVNEAGGPDMEGTLTQVYSTWTLFKGVRSTTVTSPECTVGWYDPWNQ